MAMNISHISQYFTLDKLFPERTKYNTSKSHKFSIETISSTINEDKIEDVDNDMANLTDILVQRIEMRRKKKLWYYQNMLKFCHEKIIEADNDQISDIIFGVIEFIPECKNYNSFECLEYISRKLRDNKFDTFIIDHVTMFISWKYLELKLEDVGSK